MLRYVFLLFLISVCCASEICLESDSSLDCNGKDLDQSVLNNNAGPVKNINLSLLWQKFPLFVLENATSISSPCKIAYKKFLNGVKNHNLDDVKMLDANGKLPSGILSGNVNQYGDFEECIDLDHSQYCLAEIDVQHLMIGELDIFKDLVHSYFPIKENFTDPIHRTPGFSSIRWGFCIPKECTSTDLVRGLEERLGVRAQIRPKMCQTKNKEPDISLGKTIARWYFISIILLTITSTLLHNYNVDSKSMFVKLFHCFSLKKNIESISTIEEKGDEFPVIHGMRALSALGLLCSHKSMAAYFNPYINRSKMAEMTSRSWTVVGRNAIFYTDIFIAISAILNANSLFNSIQKNKTMNFKDKVIHRVFRILPNLLSIILFYTYIVPDLDRGPQWPLVVEHHSDLCKKNMWRNILFIHNFFGFDQMCLTNTHQLGLDMQLFLLTPIFVWCLWRYTKLGLYLTIGTMIASTVLRFWVIFQNNLTVVIYFGVSVSDIMKVADLSYTLPSHRATIYLSGVLMVYLMKTTKQNPEFSLTQRVIYWTIFGIIFPVTYFGPFRMAHKTYQYDRFEAAIYASIFPVIIGYGTVSFIYLDKKGYGGWLGQFLSWKYWRYFTKIAYSLYLVQYQIYFYNVGRRKYATEFSQSMNFFEMPELFTIIMWSYILTLLIELPFQNIKKILFDKPRVLNKEKIDRDLEHKVIRDPARS